MKKEISIFNAFNHGDQHIQRCWIVLAALSAQVVVENNAQPLAPIFDDNRRIQVVISPSTGNQRERVTH